MTRLRELRTQKGLLQKDIAQFLGVDRTTYVKYESGTSEPTFDTLQRLASFFDVSVEYLMGVSNIKKAPASSEASTNIDDEIVALLEKLTEANREKAIDHIQYLIDRQEGSANK